MGPATSCYLYLAEAARLLLGCGTRTINTLIKSPSHLPSLSVYTVSLLFARIPKLLIENHSPNSPSLFEMPSETSSDQASSSNHSTIRYASSSHAAKVGYRRPTDLQRATAAGRKKIEETESELLFPAPLLLPEDELWFDPRAPPQSLRSWVREKERNEVTCDRNVLYVAGPPKTDSDVEYIRAWTVPGEQSTATGARQAQPGLPDVVDYLAAFYHGVQVKTLPPKTLNYSQWGKS